MICTSKSTYFYGTTIGTFLCHTFRTPVKNNILDSKPYWNNPHIYCRYVVDIFVYKSIFRVLKSLKEKFHSNWLHLTYDLDINIKRSFLNVQSERTYSGTLQSAGLTVDCINYWSIALNRFKHGAVKIKLFKSDKICSNMKLLSVERTKVRPLITKKQLPT